MPKRKPELADDHEGVVGAAPPMSKRRISLNSPLSPGGNEPLIKHHQHQHRNVLNFSIESIMQPDQRQQQQHQLNLMHLSQGRRSESRSLTPSSSGSPPPPPPSQLLHDRPPRHDDDDVDDDDDELSPIDQRSRASSVASCVSGESIEERLMSPRGYTPTGNHHAHHHHHHHHTQHNHQHQRQQHHNSQHHHNHHHHQQQHQQQQHLFNGHSHRTSSNNNSNNNNNDERNSVGGSPSASANGLPSAGGGGGGGGLSRVECVLDNKDMWDKFHSLNTEMIITKTGRRMFPVLKVQFYNLNPNARYAVSMDIVPVDNKRYRYAYHKSCWQVAGKADPSAEPRLYPHPDSPFNGDLLSRQVISFEKVKLTNNEMDKSGHIILNSMHKYQPRVHLIELKSTPAPTAAAAAANQPFASTATTSQLGGKLTNPGSRQYNGQRHNNNSYAQQQQQQQQQQKQAPPQLDIEGYRTYVFPETVFTAVTAYQNQLITKMKIDKNPFAKGFRDSSRLSDLDRNDPFDYMGSLGPAAACAAAAAAAAQAHRAAGGGFPSPSTSQAAAAAAASMAAAGLMMPGAGGGPPTGVDSTNAAASSSAAAAAAHMDQAYAQLLAAAQNPWYAAAAAAASANPFGGQAMPSLACQPPPPVMPPTTPTSSSAPSAGGAANSAAVNSHNSAQQQQQQQQQLQATQMWLAAFSACLNNNNGQTGSGGAGGAIMAPVSGPHNALGPLGMLSLSPGVNPHSQMPSAPQTSASTPTRNHDEARSPPI